MYGLALFIFVDWNYSLYREHFNGLTLMHVNRYIDIPTEQIINKFAMMKKRNLGFLI